MWALINKFLKVLGQKIYKIICFSFQIRSVSNEWVGREKQNVHSQTWTKFLRFFVSIHVFQKQISQKKPIKILVKSSRFLNSIDFENRLISYIS